MDKRFPFRLAGWIAMIDAVLTIPYFLLSIRLNEMAEFSSRIAESALMAGSMILSVIVTYCLGKYLKLSTDTSRFDRIIWLIIITNIMTALIFITGRLLKGINTYLEPAAIGLIIIQGIFNIRLSLQIIRSEASQQKMIMLFGWINLVTGVFLSSVVLIPLALVTSAVSEVLIATIFMQKSQEQSS